MHVVSATDFRKNMSAEVDRLVDDADYTVVTRTGGSNFVVMSKDEFNGWRETLHLLSNPANAARLRASVAAVEAGEVKEHSLVDPE